MRVAKKSTEEVRKIIQRGVIDKRSFVNSQSCVQE